MSASAEDLYKDKKLTIEEYFAFEEKMNQKFEYVDGEIFDMTGGTVNHSLIATNAVASLYRLLYDTPCTVFNSDVKLQLETVGNYFYPDAMVLCDQGEIKKNYVLHPHIIIEVLSPSTEDYDHGKKFAFYRQIKALKTYILLHQDQAFAEVYQRASDNSWLLTEYAGLDRNIPVYKGILLAMADLYRRVNFSL